MSSSRSLWANLSDIMNEDAESVSDVSISSSFADHYPNDAPESHDGGISPHHQSLPPNDTSTLYWSPTAGAAGPHSNLARSDSWTADDERNDQNALQEAIKRTRQQMKESSIEQNGLLADLGLQFEGLTTHGQLADHTKLKSTVRSDEAALQPRPHLWQLVPEETASKAEDPKGSWPARLLHVPTMTSIEWSHGNYYVQEREPAYAIISYTWGRWEIKGEAASRSPALQIRGITWSVPPVREVLFSVEDFRNVLATVAAEAGTDWVWVDIACIDQTIGSEQKTKEIGRQAKIFENASQAFIWLVEENRESDVEQDEDSTSETKVGAILRRIGIVSKLAFQSHRSWPWGRPIMPGSSAEGQQQVLCDTDSEDEDDLWIEDAGLLVANFTRIPWFTSLWCLQEAFLKPSAILLDRQGNTVIKEPAAVDGVDQPYKLSDLLSFCKQLHQLFAALKTPLARKFEDRTLLMVKGSLISMIEKSGLEALADRDRLTLYSCAGMRHAQDELDRVKGIMQVWGFQLGDSAPGDPKGRTWTLAELEADLGMALLRAYPIESQLQVHLSTVAGRQSWRISSQSATPMHRLHFAESGRIADTVDRRSSHLSLRRANSTIYAHFAGKICSFEKLRQAWTYVAEHDLLGNNKAPQHRSNAVQISLDENVVLNSTTLQADHSLKDVPEHRQLELACSMSKKVLGLDRELNVLLFGIVIQQNLYSGGERTKRAVGVIVMNAPDSTIGQWQKRLGICIWDVHPLSNFAVAEYGSAQETLAVGTADWQMDECIFG